ncbi:MAG: alpha-1,2-fucosyltransferase [Oscillospiraceae bacterium]|nr:alpha-1,2-fucosyltransferase [Oscillospiraceae bacterium]
MIKVQNIKKAVKKMLYYLKQLLSFLYKILLDLKIVKPKIIVRMDGGISSQMHQYLLGCIYREKGYVVSYDLTFFKKWAKDNYGNFERNFDLLKAFPYLKFTRSSGIEGMVYSIRFADRSVYLDHEEVDIFLYDIEPPKFLGGYYRYPEELWSVLFSNYFHIDTQVFDNYNYSLYSEITKNVNSVGVHVRRGDLAIFNNAYGHPADLDYFNRAISYIYSKIETPFFYFFSDEPQWVEGELIGKLSIIEEQYKIVNKNGSDKGYMDLFLLASCAYKITTKGSFGKFAALLSESKDNIVVLCDDPIEYIWKDRLVNPVYL